MVRPAWDYRPDSPVPRHWIGSDRFVPRVILRPILGYLRNEAAGGVVMLVAAVAAIVVANSAWSDLYFDFWSTHVDLSFGGGRLGHLSDLTIEDWVNQGLMAVFFYVVSLEIKRQLILGELREVREAVLPIAAALGGMVAPALMFMVMRGSIAASGWAIPIATDIAFALGVLALVGDRAPFAGQVFLVTMAVVDSLGAILVIAIFFTGDLSVGWALTAVGVTLIIALANRIRLAPTAVFVILGAFLWVAVLESGVHATVAGVILAALTPIHPRFDPAMFGQRARDMVDRAETLLPEEGEPANALERAELEQTQATLTEIVRLSQGTLSPLTRFESRLQPISAFVIVPIFAFANAGTRLPFGTTTIAVGVTMAVAVSLLVGKTVGISVTTWLTARVTGAVLPPGMRWSHVVGLSILGAIGFTVAIFVTDLSFTAFSPEATGAKLGIFAASIVAAIAGAMWLRSIGTNAASSPSGDGGFDRVENGQRRAMADHLEPEAPEQAGVDEETPDLAQIEPAHLLANDARERLEAKGFSYSQIRKWAETYVAEADGTADIETFIEWIRENEA